MQGISKSKHRHLIDALLQIERLLSEESEYLRQATEYRIELESMHSKYELLLAELAKVISEYRSLYDHMKFLCSGKKLKELKKDFR